MNTISWGDRSELLTKSHCFQTILLEWLEKHLLTSRDLAQMCEAPAFFEALRVIKMDPNPTYILIENYDIGHNGIPTTSSQWQRVLDPITIEILDKGKNVFFKLENGEASEDSDILEVLSLLQKISFDLSHEAEDNW